MRESKRILQDFAAIMGFSEQEALAWFRQTAMEVHQPMQPYKLIHHHDLAEFQQLIAAAMSEGWDPRGGVAVSNGEYCQALVRVLPPAPAGEKRLKEPKCK